MHTPLSAGQFTQPLPYGANLREGGTQFSVFSRSATAMRVLLYDRVTDLEPEHVVHFHPELDRWGDIWSALVPGIGAGQLYHFQADGPFEPQRGHRFDGKARLIDPYARALAGEFLPAADGTVRPPKCVVADDAFDWEGDRPLNRRLSETIIYEMHVRGFTRSPSSGVKHPGTYLGVIEKIPYLQSLGITAVELMPVFEFPTNHWLGRPETRPNYWGYDPLAFFAPHRGYAVGTQPGSQVSEFKQMVRALHQAGIEVILDVVFNHTAEGNQLGPTLSFKGLGNRVYYMLANGGAEYRNYSGCGNTVNGNHPVVREMIFLCLRHWVQNYHIDGFRFDLASILSRSRNGDLLPNPPLVEAIGEDPQLARTKIIAEAWDAAGGYQVGSFSNRRWAEWNGRYRDDVRRYWRGDQGLIGPLATRLAGSSDLYGPSGRQPFHSINFITSHDGFTLSDLGSYQEKNNAANGEENRDGENMNYSCNYGVEGTTRRQAVQKLRSRQVRNFLATLFLSQGVPMLLSGDESRRTQQGNNNAYCQDNAVSWFDWNLVDKNADLARFSRGLIAFRRRQPTVRRASFLLGEPGEPGALPDVSWFGADGGQVDWSAGESSLVCLFAAWPTTGPTAGVARHVLLFTHAGPQPREFAIPRLAQGIEWRLFVNTAADSPADIYPDADGPGPVDGKLVLLDHSLVCYVAK
ncbi:MAG TPA: glycogen debranching protein GlgX [Pirellulales bacterium]|jgi:glycogen operon protein|nr:glycogen debranching protein GlgX [Pirellulales bacterium]